MGQCQRVLMLVNLAQEGLQVFGRSPFVRNPPHRIKRIAAHANASQPGLAPFGVRCIGRRAARRCIYDNSDNGHYVKRNNSVLNDTGISQVFSFFF